MTAATVPVPARGRATSPLAQSLALGRRSIAGLVRQPQVWIPSVLFPLFFAALNTAALGRATRIPGFPEADSFLDFLLPATITQAVLFGALGGASELAQDIESGFFDRLMTSPTWRTSILVGRLTGAAVLGAFQALFFLVVFSLFGARIEAGPVGYVVLPVVATVLALAIGGLASTLALRSGSVEAVQSAFPVVFITIFISSAFFPTQLMGGWFQQVAEANPISWMIDAMRSLVLGGLDAGEVATAIAVPAVLAVAFIGLALLSLRSRLTASS